MKRWLVLIVFCVVAVFFMVASVQAVDVKMQWNSVETATGYRLFTSSDGGITWDAGTDMGNITEVTVLDVPEDRMILWKVGAYNANGDNICHWAGAWYDHRRRPPDSPWGLGVIGLPMVGG